MLGKENCSLLFILAIWLLTLISSCREGLSQAGTACPAIPSSPERLAPFLKDPVCSTLHFCGPVDMGYTPTVVSVAWSLIVLSPPWNCRQLQARESFFFPPHPSSPSYHTEDTKIFISLKANSSLYSMREVSLRKKLILCTCHCHLWPKLPFIFLLWWLRLLASLTLVLCYYWKIICKAFL